METVLFNLGMKNNFKDFSEFYDSIKLKIKEIKLNGQR